MSEQKTSISIGPVHLDGRVLLAPMSGITDTAFRRLARRFGAALVVSEMVASRELNAESADSLRRIRHAADEAPVAIQLAGNEAGAMAEAARRAEDAGAALIDINMGCPARSVCGGAAGSALMRDLDHARSLIAATVAAVAVPVTLKMRTGWDDASRNAPGLARIAEDLGIAMVTVHGRTRCQFYRGRSDWGFVRQVKQAVRVPVVVNGDIAGIDDARRALAESGADGVMVGRGAQGRPWQPGRIAAALAGDPVPAEPEGAARGDVVLEHLEDMLVHLGTQMGLRCFRKHLGWYLAALPDGPTWRRRCMRIDDPGALRSSIATAFAARPALAA